MFLLENVSKRIASATATKLSLDKDKEEVIAYGALNFFHTLLTTILLVAAGILLKSLYEVLVIALTSAVLRKYSGGTHASSPNHCAVISVILFGGLSQLVKYTQVFLVDQYIIGYQLLTLVISFVLFLMYSPVDSPNKRITKKETKDRLRRASLCCLMIFHTLCIVLWFVNKRLNSDVLLRSIVCISTGILWQSLSITILGRYVIRMLEFCLSKLKI